MSNCSDDFPTTDVFYSEISEDVPIIVFLAVASVLAISSLAIYVEELFFIHKHYQTGDQRAWKITVLLGLYPVVCIMSLISVLVPTSSTLMTLMSACYISFCIYIFIMMTIECYGGPDKMIGTLADDKVILNTPPCCCCLCCILKPITLTRKSLKTFEILAMQVMFVRPIVLFIAAVMWTDGRYNNKISVDEPYVYITVVSAISTLLSMYGLIVIFRASRLHLKHYHLALKFVPLQATIILVNLQRLVFSILAERDIPECIGSRGSRVRGENLHNALLVVETFLLCLLARKGYRTQSPDSDEILEDTTVAYTNDYGTNHTL
ncbi:organic solute transporter subunit alpha-like [Mercenaria mercenaria]|uniref:organic solute transporter subunit alpha-like n=1 Tax=Mercenaria mercenaria TaxID=6596 RepID=UPI00234F2639|nr:organic solute transporter subunit alpha-like [Mercenaria mercenaria]